MKVIYFPGNGCLNQKPSRVRVEKLPVSPQNQMILGDASFTCPTCSNVTNLKFEGMIFRSLEFHCSKCGTRHKISNPAFSTHQQNNKSPKL